MFATSTQPCHSSRRQAALSDGRRPRPADPWALQAHRQFDCVMPTRRGRTSQAFTGAVN